MTNQNWIFTAVIWFFVGMFVATLSLDRIASASARAIECEDVTP